MMTDETISEFLETLKKELKDGIFKNTKEGEFMVRFLYDCSLKEWEERGGKVDWDSIE